MEMPDKMSGGVAKLQGGVDSLATKGKQNLSGRNSTKDKGKGKNNKPAR